jgi:N-acetylglucosaminyldiphosphoundecaprenol N-acetyl-beta-D-mannosaminyltransferase
MLPAKRNILGVEVSLVDHESAVAAVIAAAESGRALKLTALAVHGLMTGALDPEQRWRLNGFDIVTPDGQPVRWALNLLHGAGLADRVCGPDLTLRVCEEAARRGISVYFYGSRLDVLDRLGGRLKERFPGLVIAGLRPSLFRRSTDVEKLEIAAEIRRSGAGIVFAGLGCPRQEVWAHEYAGLIDRPVLAVGAAFDFHAGLLAQAPPLMQRWGLEWLYRLAQEPRRLWRRYLLLNPAFLTLLAAQAMRLASFRDQGVPPRRPENYA